MVCEIILWQGLSGDEAAKGLHHGQLQGLAVRLGVGEDSRGPSANKIATRRAQQTAATRAPDRAASVALYVGPAWGWHAR
jgi:hypothetical protein